MRKDLTSIRDFSCSEILELIEFADELKKKQRLNKSFKPLLGKSIVNNFPPTSLRTRVTFEAAVNQLGGHVINLPMKLDGKEPVEDIIGYLNNWIDGLIIRYPDQKLIEKISELSKFPIINAMTSKVHPCEILSDIMTVKEKKSDLQSLKFVFIGEGANICNSWFNIAAKLNLNITQICPPGFEIDDEIYNYAKDNSEGEVLITNDVDEGIKGVDIILTDGWPPVENVKAVFKPYQITLMKLEKANTDCIVNPCPPFTRGQEIEEKVINSKFFIGYSGKENLLHMQKAILAKLMS